MACKIIVLTAVLDILYLDDELRITRGNKGSVVIT